MWRVTISSNVLIVAAALTVTSVRAGAQGNQKSPMSTAQKIENARSAGPAEIARNATVRDWPAQEGGEFPILQEGSNGWTCLPDDPSSKGNDPMCVDHVWQQALLASFQGRQPQIDRVGYAYMLSSDADVSNVSLDDTAATADNQWHHVGPHVMIIYPDSSMLAGLPTTPSSGPYVMFAGTPLAHVMWPTASGMMHMGTEKPSHHP
ncbi:MAG TPA: hypothetical protein VFK13_08390 [Gemmatimonadaceae bacterium]|nr:hypothetical protein [Gemmatimonadaceae bacterium]